MYCYSATSPCGCPQQSFPSSAHTLLPSPQASPSTCKVRLITSKHVCWLDIQVAAGPGSMLLTATYGLDWLGGPLLTIRTSNLLAAERDVSTCR
jgi:hypothetical protein